MFWRIQKFTPDVIAKRCGIYAVVLVSVLFNLALLSRVGATQAATTVAIDYPAFVKQVTRHLFDANYLTVRDSMTALPDEMTNFALGKLRAAEFVPRDAEALEATARELEDAQSVSAVRFDSIDMGRLIKKTAANGKPVDMIPVEVKIQVAVHDNDRVRVTPLHIRYYLANQTNLKTAVTRPVVFDYEEVSDQSTSNAQ